MNKSQSYWENRKARELYDQLVDAEETAEEMRQLYMQASNEIQEKARKIVKRFQLKHELSNAEAERLLRHITSPEDIEEMIRLLRLDPKNAELIAELEAPAYAARLSRLSALQASIDQTTRSLFNKVRPKMEQLFERIGRAMYYRQIFDMQQRAGSAFPFSLIDEKRLEQVINTRWSGKNFSERLWGNTEELAAAVKEQILLSILTGKSQRAMSEAIDGRFSVGSNATRRLVRTEANYVANQMQLESYKEHGVDKYIYVAILDLRTSLICRELDKKVFKIEEASPGFNYPPMHPWCRSTTIAWMPASLLKKLRQAAIDPETGKTIHISGDMTYNEWYEKYVNENPAVNFTGPGSSRKSQPKIEQLARDADNIVNDHTGLPSYWTGKTRYAMDNGMNTSRKEWNCDITLLDTADDHEAIHELLHARSISQYGETQGPGTYRKYRAMEELSVEMFTREILRAEGRDIFYSSRYNFRILQLRWLNKTYSIEHTDYDFAKALFAQKPPNRAAWLDQKILNGSKGVVEYNRGMSVLESVLRWK